jgi:hypothetical protein
MTNICFVSSWAEPEALLTRFSQYTPNRSGRWGKLKGVTSIEKADYLVVLDFMCQKRYPREEVHIPIIHFRIEPQFIRNFTAIKGAKVMEFEGGGFYPALWWISHSYDALLNLPYTPKAKCLGEVVSGKWPKRNDFNRSLAKILDFDIYGSFDPKGRSNYKGGLGGYHDVILSPTAKGKETGIDPYKYSIVLENSSQPNYFTEKLHDCLLLWSLPIYWGCPNIHEFFPENSYYLLNLDNPEEVLDIIKRPIEKKHIAAMGEARHLILHKYNIWAAVENIISDGGSSHS